MQLAKTGMITQTAGLVGDVKGARFPRRQLTLLALADWQSAVAELGAAGLAWTARRANLLVTGLRLPRARGARITIGPVELEVTGQTYPCRRMEDAHPGLLKALAREWRGGVTTRVVRGGEIVLGSAVRVTWSPPEELPLPLPS